MEQNLSIWMDAVRETVASYRRMIDGCLAQLSDEEMNRRPAPEINSVAIILRHLGGNLRSRWTDFLTTDGEKPYRDRETEFLSWEGDRRSLMQYFESGWSALTSALDSIDEANVTTQITIRGESHTVPQAIERSITHLAYHVGQIAIIARLVHEGSWQWQTIAPGKSKDHNDSTWGTAASRGAFGEPKQ